MPTRLPLLGPLLGALILTGQASAQGLPPQVEVHRDLIYGDHGSSTSLDLYLPTDARSPVPLVIWIHGGGWESGEKRPWPALVLVDKGFAVASINYRLTGEATFPAQIHDCKAVVRLFRAEAKRFGIDPGRIGVWGASAGGHLAALLGTSAGVKDLEGSEGGHPGVDSRVQAVCDWFGPTDLARLAESETGHGNLPADYASGIVLKLLGGPVGSRSDLAALANPITFVTEKAPPFLIMHGDSDRLVPIEQSRILERALKKSGVPAFLRVVPGKGHERFDDVASLRIVEEFFDKALRRRFEARIGPLDQPARSVATFNHAAGANGYATHEFFENGRLDSPDGMHTWTLKGDTLVFCWYLPEARDGVWVDTCTLSEDGNTYQGVNQIGTPIRARKIVGVNLRDIGIH